MPKIDSALISVVVQGGVHPLFTPLCLESLRRALPRAVIILSTWKQLDPRGFDCDELVLSDDPGARYSDSENKVLNNFNRQLVSTQAGLRRVRTPYALKFRSDMVLGGADFLQFFGRYDAPKTPARYFKNRILVLDYYTRNPRILPVPFHPSDWVAFGNTRDLLDYYDIPLQPPEEFHWFLSHKKISDCFPNLLMRYAAEQYFCIRFLQKKEKVDVSCYYDAREENVTRTERFFAESLVVLDYGRQMDARFLKRRPNYLGDSGNIVRHGDWKRLYRHYCAGDRRTQWSAYLLSCRMRRFFFYAVRREILRLLDGMGLKTTVKRLFERFSVRRAESRIYRGGETKI